MYNCGLFSPAGVVVPGMGFGTPPILNYGTKELQDRVLPDLLLGKKRTCIAVTEPGYGSDVGNLETEAVKDFRGEHYIVSGSKKW